MRTISLAVPCLLALLAQPLAAQRPPAQLAGFDAYVTNVDRTPRNTNLLMWHRQLKLIDHGAALYFHHAWSDPLSRTQDPFSLIKDHVLLKFASRIAEVDEHLTGRLTPDRLANIVAAVPDAWLSAHAPPQSPSADSIRDVYRDYLIRRLHSPRPFVEEAIRARSLLV